MEGVKVKERRGQGKSESARSARRANHTVGGVLARYDQGNDCSRVERMWRSTETKSGEMAREQEEGFCRRSCVKGEGGGVGVRELASEQRLPKE